MPEGQNPAALDARINAQEREIQRVSGALDRFERETRDEIRGLRKDIEGAKRELVETFRAELAKLGDRFVSKERWEWWERVLWQGLLAVVALGAGAAVGVFRIAGIG